MIHRMPTHCGDDTVASCVVAGDYIFLAHHGGGSAADNIETQMRAAFENIRKTLSSVGASLDDIVKLDLYLRDISDLRRAADVYREYLPGGVARMTTTTQFVDPGRLCQMDGIAYRPRCAERE